MSGFDALPPGLGPPPAARFVGATQSEGVADEIRDGRSGFGARLQEALHEVVTLQKDAHDKAMALARGEPVQLHDVLIAMGKSEVAFNLALEVRNRLLQAWETLARTTT